MEAAGNVEDSVTVVFTNTGPDPLTIVLEPWADEHELPAGSRAELTSIGPESGQVEIELRGRYVVFYAPSAGTVRLLIDGRDVDANRPGPRPAFPPVPEGFTTREFLHTLFGRPKDSSADA